MRIALVTVFPVHVIPGYEKYLPRGHYATWLPQLCRAFSQQQEFDLHWLFFSREVHRREPIQALGQTFHILPATGRLRMLRGYLADCRAVRRRLDEIQPDLVHAWGTEDSCGLAAAASGRPWLLSMQGILGEYLQRAPMHPFVRLQALYESRVLARAREISVESKWGRRILERRAPQAHLHLVEYGVQELFFQHPWKPEPARPVALFVGSLDARKGIRDAIEAFRDPRLAGAELHVIGEGAPRFTAELRALASPQVRWLGKQGPEATAAALAKAWCLVLPTRADTSPNVVKEARVIGLPVATTPEGGQSDYILDGENGFLAAPGDVPKLAEGLVKLLSDYEQTRALGRAHWEEQRAFFRPEHTATRFLQLYRSLTGTMVT
jgi:glycosyltransferase involved in cell wall biosynthesis